MKKHVLRIASFLLGIFLVIGSNEKVYASEGEEKITITIDASDDNSGLLYAIDSDRPEAFSETNTFTIAAGTSHVIYVKDAAGNITSQTYTHKISNPETKEEELNIEVGINNTTSYSKYDEQINKNYDYLTDTKIDNSDANVISKITTDGSDLAEKVFYVITTQEGEEFYLVIEQGSSNKVHLLNTVTLDDLTALADGGSTSNPKDGQDNLLEALKGNETGANEDTIENVSTNDKSSEKSNNLYIYLLIVMAGGAYYYFKIYKNKKNESMDAMDAMDMDEFIMEEDDEEEDLEFDDKEKQELLNRLLNGEEDEETQLQDMNPDEYAGNVYEEKSDEYTEDAYATSHEDVTESEQEEGEESMYITEDVNLEFDEELDGEEEE